MRGSRTRRRVTTTRTSPGSLPRRGIECSGIATPELYRRRPVAISALQASRTGEGLPEGATTSLGDQGRATAAAGAESGREGVPLVPQGHPVGRLDAARVPARGEAEHVGGPAADEPG